MFRHKRLSAYPICFPLLALTLVPRLWPQEPTVQPGSLPPAKEELLGELSPQTDVPGPRTAGGLLREYFSSASPEADYAFDPGSLRFAARAKQGTKWVLIVDGKERGVFDGVESILVSPGGRHVNYSAKRAGRWVKMLDDKELGPAFDELGGGSWLFGDVDLEHYAYPGLRGKRWLMVADGKEGPEYERVGSPSFSRDGRHLAYAAKRMKGEEVVVLDGKEGPVLESANSPRFSPDGQHMAYHAKHEKKREAIITDGKEGPEFEEVGAPTFSPDGQHLAYHAKLDNKREAVVIDGKVGPEFEEIGGLPVGLNNRGDPIAFALNCGDMNNPVYSPDGGRLAYFAKRSKKWRMVVDGQEGPEFKAEVFSGPLFTDDSRHVVYVALENLGKALEVRDDKPPAEVAASFSGMGFPFLESPVITPDGQRLAYILGGGGEHFELGRTTRARRYVVVDGKPGKMYDALAIDLAFSEDGRHIIYSVRGGVEQNKSTIVIDGKEGKLYDDVIGGALRKAEGGDSSRHTLVYIAREGKKFFRVTQPLP